MITFPPCKINLGLNIISKRHDGYHNIVTCFFPVPWTDILEVIPSSNFSFSISGHQIPGGKEDNLCVKAYELLRNDFDVAPVQIHLHKVIPTGAGLGGGSSDAAHTLRLINEVAALQLSNEILGQYASRLGSDCAFFVQDEPKLGTGRGEILQDVSISLKGKYLVVVKPPIHVSTAEAYTGVAPAEPDMDLKNILEKQPINAWRSLLKNDFEVSVFKKYPDLQIIKEKLYSLGAIYASMSGSGSSIFAFFDQAIEVKMYFPGTDTWIGKLTR